MSEDCKQPYKTGLRWWMRRSERPDLLPLHQDVGRVCGAYKRKFIAAHQKACKARAIRTLQRTLSQWPHCELHNLPLKVTLHCHRPYQGRFWFECPSTVDVIYIAHGKLKAAGTSPQTAMVADLYKKLASSVREYLQNNRPEKR